MNNSKLKQVGTYDNIEDLCRYILINNKVQAIHIKITASDKDQNELY